MTIKFDGPVDISDWVQPGVFRVYCRSTNRSFFGESFELLPGLEQFRFDLRNGICKNEELLHDFQAFGEEDFSFIGIVSDFKYDDDEIRREALEEMKNEWDGPLY